MATAAPGRSGGLLAIAGLRLLALLVLGLAVLGVLGLVVLDSPVGHRLVTDRIAALKLQSGVAITIGRIDGSLFGAAQLHDIVLADADGRFMTVPEATLDWRPMPALALAAGLGGGLDIRDLTLKRGLLLRAPRLVVDPKAPILPDFDIRLDHLAVENLAVAPGLAGARRRIDLAARALVHGGRVVLDSDGRLGGHDKLAFHLDSEPDRDRFALSLDYRAPRDGLLAALTGVRRSVDLQIGGTGRFTQWHGSLLASADGRRLAGGLIDNRAGQYRLTALLHPGVVTSGSIVDLAGERVGVTFAGTFAGGRIDGHVHAANVLGRIDGAGALDLVRNRADGLALVAQLQRPEALPRSWRQTADPGPARLVARIDGRFADLAITHDLTVSRLATGVANLTALHTAGVAHWHSGRLDVPLAVIAATVDTGTPWLDQRLAGARLTGPLRIDGNSVSGEGWHVTGRGASALLALKGDLRRGAWALAGRVDARGVNVPRVGVVDATAKGVLAFGQTVPWTIAVNYAGTGSHFANAGLAGFVGDSARVSGSLHWGAGRLLVLPDMRVTSPSVTMTAAATLVPGAALTLTAQGRHQSYGPFTAHAAIDRTTTTADAHFAGPLPAGISAVDLALGSTPGGYHLVATGASPAGPIAAAVDFTIPPVTSATDPARMTLTDVRVFHTRLTGTLAFAAAGLDGDLALAGGGIDGTIHFAGRSGGAGVGGQAIDAMINARSARFGSDRPISIARASLMFKSLSSRDRTTLGGSLQAQGVAVGGFFISRLLADATIVNGSGRATASLAGRRGTRFALQGTATIAPEQVVAYLAGEYAGNTITMPRRAVIERKPDGWVLQPSQINFGSGALIGSGRFGAGTTEVHLAVSRMPLSTFDIVYADLGLGGFASGVIDYRNDHNGAPEGHAALTMMGLTRSGLVLTSRPLDLAVVGVLDARALQVRAVAREGTLTRMRLQALVNNLPRGGSIIERLRAGTMRGQLRYAGPADALWRLAAIDAFDLTGPVGIAADFSGSVDAPVLTGAVVSHGLRVQSTLSGSDIQAIDVIGSFSGTRLSLARFSGTTPGGGRVAGSGTIDFSAASSERPKMDLRIGATNAQLVNRPEMAATITGPMRIVSDGHAGTIAGRLHIDRARWVLGQTAASASLPTVAVTERNAPADASPPPQRGPPWTLLIDAAGANRIDVRGMGLSSEWQADVHIRGDTANPQIVGNADVITGTYDFAGKRFDLTRGRIRFDGSSVIDPQLDIVAVGDANDVSATITIGGSAQRPQISFSSVPALPEEELLSRILFGSSISQISAPEAIQLASALAALRGGGGLDPINKLRRAIGLDRLRVLSADPTIGRGTALAVGKYLGRRFYIELVTDGHGYNATSIEFRLTRWLSLLGTISTLYDESISLKYSKDY